MKKLMIASSAALCILTSCSPASEQEKTTAGAIENQSAAGDQPILEEQRVSGALQQHNETESPTLAETEASTPTPATPERVQSFPISFQKIQESQPLKKISTPHHHTLVTQKKIDDFVVEIYRIAEDQEHMYASIQAGSVTYEIGIAGQGSHKAGDFAIEQVRVLAKSYIKITGSLGANVPITHYVAIEKSPPVLLAIEAHTFEGDIDGDGSCEIIATVRTAADTTIYKLAGRDIVSANLNSIMKAELVQYVQESNTFKAVVEKRIVSDWTIENDSLVRIQQLSAALIFQPVENPQQSDLGLIEEPLTRDILLEKQTKQGTFFIYKYRGGEENEYHGAYRSKVGIYDLGVVSMSPNFAHIEPSDIFGKKTIRLSGFGEAKWGYFKYYQIVDS